MEAATWQNEQLGLLPLWHQLSEVPNAHSEAHDEDVAGEFEKHYGHSLLRGVPIVNPTAPPLPRPLPTTTTRPEGLRAGRRDFLS